MPATMNGYPVIPAIDARLALVAVEGHSTRLLAGPVATVLGEVGRRFHAEVEPVSTFNGWRSAALNTASGGIATSNHLSGTAVDINGYRHPRYAHGTFTAGQMAAIRKILADLGGVVRWGGDWNGDGRLTEADTDEMHFEVIAPLASVTTVANRINVGGTVPVVPPVNPPDDFEETDMDASQNQRLINIEASAHRVDLTLDAVGDVATKLNTILQYATDIRNGVAGLPGLIAGIDHPGALSALSDADVARVAKAVSDEQAKRLAQ